MLNSATIDLLFKPSHAYNLGSYQAKHYYEWKTGEYMDDDEFVEAMSVLGHTCDRNRRYKLFVPRAVYKERFIKPFQRK